ncbi:MAG TPA: TadE/TadG family type IV pilus assembly protein [Caulobacteraceae bacterium]
MDIRRTYQCPALERCAVASARLRSMAADSRGVAAVEFAIFVPILCLMLAGAVDLGGVLYAEFQINNAVSAGAAYAQLNAAQVNSTNGATLAQNVATVVETQSSQNDSVVVNNGPTSTITRGSQAASGTASNADSCYCPTGSASAPTWGSSAACGTACPGSNTGYAGKFITISASTTYTPMFSSYGIVQNGTISAASIVQVK